MSQSGDNGRNEGEEEYYGDEEQEEAGNERNYGAVENNREDEADSDGEENIDGNRIYGEEEQGDDGRGRAGDEEMFEEVNGEERDRFSADNDPEEPRARRVPGQPGDDGNGDPDDDGDGPEGAGQAEDFEDDMQNNNYEGYDPDEDDAIPEYANEANKKLNEDIKLRRKEIKQLQFQFEEVKERLNIMKDHQKYIMLELKNTQLKIERKNEETDSEKHMSQLAERQIGKLTADLRKYDQRVVELQDRLSDIQQQIFKGNDQLEKMKLEINWNKEEKKQWIIAVQQKEEDRLTLKKYRRQDNQKIKELSLHLEKLTIEKNRKEYELEKEVTETQALQIEIDKTAEEFKKQHADRHALLAKWDEAIQNIAYRHELTLKITTDTVTIGMQMKNNKEILNDKKQQLHKERQTAKKYQDDNIALEREIAYLKSIYEELKNNEVELDAKIKINQNTLSADSSQLAEKKNQMEMLERELQSRKQRLTNAKKKYEAQVEILKSEESIEKYAKGTLF